jgi:hypothetical protein
MMLNRKGMNATCYDPKLSLQVRWDYSRQLADQLNGSNEEQINQINSFASENIAPYFKELQKIGLSEAELFWFALDKNWKSRTFFKVLFQLPFFLMGLIHFALPHFFVKRFVESKFKRKVFWSSTKLGMLLALLPIWNLLLFLLASIFISLDGYVWILLFIALNPVALAYYLFIQNTTLLVKSLRYNAQSLQSIVEHRHTVLAQLEKLQF